MPKPKRKQISTRQRFEVFKRDGFVCQYCGAHPPTAILHVDHIHPVKDGGTNDQDNLITSCVSCNLGKSAVPLNSVPQSLKDKAALIKEQERQIAGYNEIFMQKRRRLEESAWEVAMALENDQQLELYSTARLRSIKLFVEKLGLPQTLDHAERAYDRVDVRTDGGFRYFCGCCWNDIREAESTSEQVVSG